MARKGYKTASFTLPDGTRKYVYAKTQEELDEKVFQLKLQLKMGVDLQDKTTLGELIKLWYTTEVEPNVRENTAANLKCVLNKHLMPLVAHYPAKDVTPAQVKLWLNETGKLNKNAAKSCHRALKNAFSLAEENGLIYKSPVLERFKAGGVESKKRTALTPTEEQQLLDAVAPTRAHLLVWFLLAAGARRGEALEKGPVRRGEPALSHPAHPGPS
jgi:integrase